jgi:hypothetical protein
MGIRINYDIRGATPEQRNKIQSIFERFRWVGLGGSTYGYPARIDGSPEDWLNHIVPALMCFRSYILKQNMILSHFNIDPHFNQPPYHHAFVPPCHGGNIDIARNDEAAPFFGRAQLIDWLDSVTNAIPYT